MKKILLLTSLLTLCTAMTCDDDTDDVFYLKYNQQEFDQQRTLWEKSNHQNYSYKLYYFSSATGPQTSTIEVENGMFVSSDNQGAYPYSIDDIFKRIEDDVQNSLKNKPSEIYGVTMDIKYNQQYHYPEKVYYTVAYKTDVVGGGYYDLTVTDFQLK